MTYASPRWKNDVGGNWSDAANWSDGPVPNAVDAAARLYPASASRAINVDTTVTLGSINFYSPNSYILSGSDMHFKVAQPTSPESAAKLDRINVGSGSHLIDNNIALGDTTSIAVDLGNSTLTLSGTISGSTGIQKDGYGTLVLSRSNTFNGPVTLNGVVDATSPTTTGTLAGGPIAISASSNLGNGTANNTLIFAAVPSEPLLRFRKGVPWR